MERRGISRRDFIKTGLVTAASAASLRHGILEPSRTWAASPSDATLKGGPMDPLNLMSHLSKYIVEAGGKSLPEAVSQEAKHHILDTIAAMVSGSRPSR